MTPKQNRVRTFLRAGDSSLPFTGFDEPAVGAARPRRQERLGRAGQHEAPRCRHAAAPEARSERRRSGQVEFV